MQVFLTALYAEATGIAQAADNVLMNVEVVLHESISSHELDSHLDVPWEHIFVSQNGKHASSTFLYPYLMISL